jgi:hypothetical protein
MSVPISTSDESAFYAHINGMDRSAALEAIESELRRTKSPEFVGFLKGLRYFLQCGSIPSSFQGWQVARLRFYAKDLVDRGVLNDSVLLQFAETSN